MDFDQFDLPDSFDSASVQQGKHSSGGWYWPLTLLALVLVSALSFLMAWLTKDVQERSLWLMGLIFMVPAGAMFFSAMLLEFTTGAMTPAVSRGPQIKVAIIATVATFLVASLCDGLYLLGGFVGDSSDNLIFLDYEKEISGNSPTDQAVMQVLDDLYLKSGSRVETALFMFSTDNMDLNNSVIPLKPFTKDHLEEMREALINGKMNQSTFYGHENAYEMVENSGTTKPTRVILINDSGLTYGDGSYTQTEWDRDLKRLEEDRIILYFMGKGTPDKGMVYMAEHSGGMIVSGYEAENVLENLQRFVHADGDMVRTDTQSAQVLCGIMLGLEGIVIGLGLMLSLSRQGQKRFQAIFSPLMALLAFLILKVIPRPAGIEQWVLEGIAFSLFGIVFMTQNYAFNNRQSKTAVLEKADSDVSSPASSDSEIGW